MIEKLQNIRNVGRLVTAGGGGLPFILAENTHIYAANTHGKSTFTAIIRSLQSNNPDFIKGRKTFGSTGNQQVVLPINGANHIFDGSSWNNPFENIRIFDTRYIRDSFFSPDEEITDDGQRKIETFILGTEGVRLAKDVVDLTANQRENSNKLSAITREYNGQKQYGEPSLDDFLLIEEIQGVDVLIDEKTRLLNTYKNQTKINTLLTNLLDNLSAVDFTHCKNELKESLSVDIAQITEHIHTNIKDDVSDSDAKRFLSDGVNFQKNESICPFCSQSIDSDTAKALLGGYSEYFSQSYNDMANNRNRHSTFFATWDIVSKLRKAVIDLADLEIQLNLTEADDRLNDLIQAFNVELEKKKDFSYSVDFSSLLTIEQEITALIKSLSKIRTEYEGDLSDKIADAKSTLDNFELSVKRHTEPWKSKCGEYQDIKTQNDSDITPKLTLAITAQSTYADSVYATSMDKVNECLEALGVNFRVENLVYRGRSRNDLFSLVFDDTHPVGIATSSAVTAHTSKHTLSESDRRALCFAFFMASVVTDTECANLIVVLDDPVSSFDSDRRTNTVKYIERMRSAGVTPNQLITLTHDRDFYKILASRIRNNSKNLILEWNPSTQTSNFNILDLTSNKLFMSDFYRRLYELQQSLLLPDSELTVTHLQNVRFLIENIMKRKYYTLLESDIKALKSIETFIETLSRSGMPYENESKLIADIRGLSPHTVHHDQDNPGGYDLSSLGSSDIRQIIDETLQVLQRL